MKIGNSTVKFNLTIAKTPSGEKTTLQNVPYWRLYSRKGDDLPNWRSPVVLTYEGVINLVKRQNEDGIRCVLEAYPRFSTARRKSYKYCIENTDFVVKDKYTNITYCKFDIVSGALTFRHPDCKYPNKFWNKFFFKSDLGDCFTILARDLIDKL